MDGDSNNVQIRWAGGARRRAIKGGSVMGRRKFVLVWLAANFAVTAIKAEEPTVKAVPPAGLAMHKQHVERAKNGNIDVVFFGDSAISGWSTTGKEWWDKHLKPRKVVNFGIGSNTTANLLWRLQNGELDGYEPKVVYLHVGAGDIGLAKDGSEKESRSIAAGIEACIQEVRKRHPKTGILVTRFPEADLTSLANLGSAEKVRALAKAVNARLDQIADGKQVRLIDAFAKLADHKAELLEELKKVKDPHQLTLAYKLWWEALEKPLAEMLAKAGK
jgi:lysophospholipase L1-like esterase